MPDDALAKAAEAIGGYVYGRYCSRCRVASVANCPTCPAEQLRNDDGLDLARAVLEAAGYDKLQAVTEAARNFLQNCRVMDCFLYGDDDPDACMTVETCWKERLKTALQRAGKEA